MIFKKEIVQNILQKLAPYREEAEWLSLVIASSEYTEETVDWLVHFLSQGVLHAKNAQQKKTLEKAVAIIKKMQSKEKLDTMVDQEAADILLQDLELE